MSKKPKDVITHEELRLNRIEQLAHMRHIERLTVAECAQRLGVSVRTVHNYLADEDFAKTIEKVRKDYKEGAITHVAELAQTALKTMEQLMGPETKSEHVRFEAAAKIGDWLGLGQLEQDHENDDHGELDRLYRLLRERPISIVEIPVEPGGLLPSAIRRDVDIDAIMRQVKGEVVEGTITEESH